MPSLNWFIMDSGLKNIKLLSATQQQNSPITSVNVLDNPDVIKWFKRDELILTTGFVFKEHPELIESSIQEMKRAGCCALGIKIPRFFRQVPSSLLAIAEQYKLPILELPYFYSFSEIMQRVFHQIDVEAFASQHRRQSILDQLLHAVLSHTSLSELLKITANQLDTITVFLDRHQRVLACGIPSGDSLQAAQLMEVLAKPRLSSEHHRSASSLSFQERHYTLTPFELPNKCGTLCLAHAQGENAQPDENFMQSLVQFFALSYEQNHLSERSYENRSSGFLHYLLDQKDTTISELRDLCSFYGFPYQKSWICLTISTRQLPDEHKSDTLLILQNLLKELTVQERTLLSYADENIFCSFFIFPPEFHALKAIQEVEKLAWELTIRLRHITTTVLPTGFSTFHTELPGIRRAFNESLQAMTTQEAYKSQVSVSYLAQLPLHILSTASPEDRQLLVQNLLHPLICYDQENQTQLLATLITYLQEGNNITAAAKALFLHRNTMIHRLGKIKELLHLKLDNPQELLLLRLALLSQQLEGTSTC